MPIRPEQHLATYIPALSRVGGVSGGPPLEAPQVVSTFCTVLFADLSGFTSRTEELSRLRNGPELIGRLLNAHLGPLVDIIEAHGGDIVKFAGDAVLVCWEVDQAHDGVRTTVLAAAMCALKMQEAIRRLEESAPERTMRLRVGLATGPVRVIHLGSQDARRVLLVTGDGVDRATKVGTIGEPGEVRIGRLAHQLVGEELRTVRTEEAPLLSEVQPFDPVELPAPPSRHWDPRFRAYLPRTVTHRVRGQTGTWLTETRVVTVMFVHFGKITIGSDPRRMNEVFEATHSHLEAHGGVTNKLSVDEKGATLLAVFGLPPVVYEDNAARACRAALAVHGALKRLGEQPSIGLATGRAFCGEVGGKPRREYTVIGDTVNISARLMQKAQGGIACESATAKRAQRHVQFEAMPSVRLKGKSVSVDVYRPVAVVDGATSPDQSRILFGRDSLLRKVADAIQTARDTQTGQSIVLSGGAGVGKSSLRSSVIRSASDSGLAVLRTSGEALRSTRPGHALRRILTALYGTGQGASEIQLVRDALMSAAGEQAAFLPHLDELLPVPLGLTKAPTAPPPPDTRAELLSRLILAPLRTRPALLAVDNGQWLDPLTIQVLHRISRSPSPTIVLVATRPPPDASAVTWTALRTLAPPTLVPGLDLSQTRTMLAHNLGVDQVPSRMAEVVQERSGGNPLFALQLLEHLLETGAVEFQDGQVVLKADRLASWQAQLPADLEGLLLSRVDHLGAESQLTLKVASVFGERFSTAGLVAVHPLVDNADQLAADLQELCEQGIIATETDDGPAERWKFQHTLIRDAVYEIIPSAQKKQLHDVAATHFQSRNPVQWFDVAVHYQSADSEDRAYDAYSRAASHSALHGTSEDCAKILKAVDRLAPLFPPAPEQAVNIAFARAVVLRAGGKLSAARDQLGHALEQMARDHEPLQETRDSLDPPTVRLFAAQLDLDAGLPEQAHERASRVFVDSGASIVQKTSAAALRSYATWQTQGPEAALRARHARSNWEGTALHTLLTLVTAESAPMQSETLHALMEQMKSPDVALVDSAIPTQVGAALVGILMFMGDAPAALRMVQDTALASFGEWRQPLEVLLKAPATCDHHASIDSSRDHGLALQMTICSADAVLAVRRGEVERAAQKLDELARAWPLELVPTPEIWPALFVAAKLAAPLCSDGSGLSGAPANRLSALLQRAGQASPGVEPAFRWLRAKLAEARGQRIRAWWWTQGLTAQLHTHGLTGVMGDWSVQPHLVEPA